MKTHRAGIVYVRFGFLTQHVFLVAICLGRWAAVKKKMSKVDFYEWSS
jgi:hypothetical protein